MEELDLAEPGPGEVTIRVRASGLCHSDDHNVTGDSQAPLPVVGGHEGSGEVVSVGPGVDRFSVGDRVATFPMPACGRCRYCSSGRSHLCDLSARTMMATAGENARFRFHRGDVGVGAYTQLGTFSEYTTISVEQAFALPDDIPFAAAALVGCGVSTGFGATRRVAPVSPGDHVVVIGVGGVGAAAVQGARVAGASTIMAIDPVPFKLEQAVRFGATHTAHGIGEALPVLREVSWGAMADVVVVAVGVMHGEMLAAQAELVAKGGSLVMTAVAPLVETTVALPLTRFALAGKSLVGNLAGSTNPVADFDEMWRLYRAGQVQLDEMVTRTYSLDQVNKGYEDMHAGRNVRGLVVFD